MTGQEIRRRIYRADRRNILAECREYRRNKQDCSLYLARIHLAALRRERATRFGIEVGK